ncbi:hypothetical protein F2P81_011926 [Scophthalmus maximus]|uniref:PDZ domain-containing protein n=1 Tax=Scophthalmus maximus TaxID=52904 RepID=A0A6A4SZY6_SCOMX|nr:hypothetical protein F2P81_011926 [Scophthalmus maximus]
MHKDSSGHVGFIYKSGKITSLVKEGSAARNGLLTEHFICEINGQNVIGLKDSQIKDILSTSPTAMTITIMPKFIYEHMIKRYWAQRLCNPGERVGRKAAVDVVILCGWDSALSINTLRTMRDKLVVFVVPHVNERTHETKACEL